MVFNYVNVCSGILHILGVDYFCCCLNSTHGIGIIALFCYVQYDLGSSLVVFYNFCLQIISDMAIVRR